MDVGGGIPRGGGGGGGAGGGWRGTLDDGAVYSIARVFIPKIGNQDINNYMHVHIYDPSQKPVHSDRDQVTAVAFSLTSYILSSYNL